MPISSKFALVLLCIFNLLLWTPSAHAGVNDGLVGWWKFDEGSGASAADSSGQGNTGTLTNSPTWVSGWSNKALQFNGSSQYITCGSGFTTVDLIDKTISAWIRKTANSQKGIVDKDFDIGGANYGGWGFWTNTNGKLWFWLQSLKDLKDNGSATISLGAWTHVLVVWHHSTDTADFYINGRLNSSISDNTIVEKASGAADLEIANLRNNLSAGTYAFDGSIDDVRIYNRALTAAEVQALYAGTKIAHGKINGKWNK
jgi:hypothetical protein